ncbi:hypothetical protein AX16_009756 [Volvariella volvacea WC 439]|nr:hypothetical protein AX16_009756 [Volvariella volvacea WC 439]
MISAPSSSSNPLKRTRDHGSNSSRPSATQSSGAKPPPLPTIQSLDLILTVFTHKSLRPASGPSPQACDNEGLAELGECVLNTVISKILFSCQPPLDATDIAKYRSMLLSDANFMTWVELYELKNRLCCTIDVRAKLDTAKEARTLICAYVGGVFAESSNFDLVQNWMDALIRDERFTEHALRSVSIPSATTPPPKRVKSEEPPPAIFFGQQPPAPLDNRSIQMSRQRPPHMSAVVAPPPSTPPPPLPPLPNPLSPAQPHMPFLPSFNERATQRGSHVEYRATSTGPRHAPSWSVQCVVNGITKGYGQGPNKSMAKEQAARAAYYAMGWT